MSKNDLAIFGGRPVRTRPFTVGPMIDEDEKRLVLQAIDECNFSRYIGSTSPDIDEVLYMSSEDASTVDSDWHFLGGKNVRLFAAEFAAKFGVKYAIPVNSATSGLSVALAASGIGPCDEVIVPALSFTASGTSVLMFNSIPVFVDVDPRTCCLDVKKVAEAITPRTRAIMAVHLLGNACDMDALIDVAKNHDLKIIEDSAQAPGSKYKGKHLGTIGDAGVFSFQQSKNIMTGEGGMIVTNNPEIAKKCRLIINHGEVVMDDHHCDEELENIVGFNFRMPELCAALGRAQLKKLESVNDWRNRNCQYLIDSLRPYSGIEPMFVSPEVDCVHHVGSFRFNAEKVGIDRELFLAAVRAEGIPMGSGYVRLMYQNPLFKRRIAYGRNGCPWACGQVESKVVYQDGQCSVAEALINERLIWMYHIAYPSTPDDMKDVVRAIEKVLDNRDILKENRGTILPAGGGKKSQGRIL